MEARGRNGAFEQEDQAILQMLCEAALGYEEQARSIDAAQDG
jgi:hypothetical protein